MQRVLNIISTYLVKKPCAESRFSCYLMYYLFKVN